ncbi:MAG TPA: hypothetical protein VGW78_07285 [Candidatus Babeliales bacterium]|jgi:hypothetical protein|nr:hypothetical protein [Candidatus Babeliales bacterium]
MKIHITIIVLMSILGFIQLYTADNPIDRTIALMFEKGKDTYTAIIVITDHQKPDKKIYLYMSDPQFIDKVTIKNEKTGILHIKDSSFFNNIILTRVRF